MPRHSEKTTQIFVFDPGIAERAPLDLDPFERAFLTIARHFISNFEEPSDQCWMQAFLESERVFPPPFGATIAHAIAIILTCVRDHRQSAFSYFRVGDPLADMAMTKEERYLILTLRGTRFQQKTMAQTNALLLCEGDGSSALLEAVARLCIITGDGKPEP
ncbi:MAG: hypothetical protein AAGA12_12000 [Pseudomonadota bacterium]